MAKIILDTTELQESKCQVPGCRSKGPYYRHHKGCDHMLGLYNHDIKARYYEYLDCVLVCDRCHMKIHYLYMPILRNWQQYTWHGVVELRQFLIQFCNQILAGEVKLKEPTEEFKKRWKKKRKAWKRRTRRK